MNTKVWVPTDEASEDGRILVDDTLEEIVNKLSEGNPGAISVCTSLYNSTPKIDPQACLGGYDTLLYLDTFQVYGSKIWILFKDICGSNISHTIAALRAVQMGIISREKLKKAIDGEEQLNMKHVVGLVKEKLQEFQELS